MGGRNRNRGSRSPNNNNNGNGNGNSNSNGNQGYSNSNNDHGNNRGTFKNQHQNGANGNRGNGNRNGNERPKCNTCGKIGHVDKDCFSNKAADSDIEMGGVNDLQRPTYPEKPKCEWCGKRHPSEYECFAKKSANGTSGQHDASQYDPAEPRIGQWRLLLDEDMRMYVEAQEKQRLDNITHELDFYIRGHIRVSTQTCLPYDKAWSLFSACDYDENRAFQHCNNMAIDLSRELQKELQFHGQQNFTIEDGLDLVTSALMSTHWNEDQYREILSIEVIRKTVNVQDKLVARTILGLHGGDVRIAITGIQTVVQTFARNNDCKYEIALECFNRFGFSELNALEGYRKALVPFFAKETSLDEERAKYFLEQSKWKLNAARIEYKAWLLSSFEEKTGLYTVDDLRLCRDLLKENNYNLYRCMQAFTGLIATQIGWNQQSTAKLIEKCGGNIKLIQEEWQKTPITAQHLVE